MTRWIPACSLTATCALAWHRRAQPLARALAALCVLDLLGYALTFAGLPTEPGGPPLTGWVRVAAHVQQAKMLAWPCIVAWAFLGTLARRYGPTARETYTLAARLLAAVVALVWVVLVSTYPAIRGGDLMHVYAAARVLCSAVCILAAVVRWRPFARAEMPVLVLAAGAFVQACAGPLWGGHWDLASSISITTYGGVCVALAGAGKAEKVC